MGYLQTDQLAGFLGATREELAAIYARKRQELLDLKIKHQAENDARRAAQKQRIADRQNRQRIADSNRQSRTRPAAHQRPTPQILLPYDSPIKVPPIPENFMDTSGLDAIIQQNTQNLEQFTKNWDAITDRHAAERAAQADFSQVVQSWNSGQATKNLEQALRSSVSLDYSQPPQPSVQPSVQSAMIWAATPPVVRGLFTGHGLKTGVGPTTSIRNR